MTTIAFKDGGPAVVRAMCERLPPWFYYEMPKTGQTLLIRASSEDGTVRATIVADRISAPTITPFDVFGIAP